jgi:hypothetical protein
MIQSPLSDYAMIVKNFKRIGIEAEIHSYTISGKIANKQVLAKSTCSVIDGDLNIPLLQIVSEGAGTGTSYFELVFGPVIDDEIAKVVKVIEIAKGIAPPKNEQNVLSFSQWVETLKQVLTKNRYAKFCPVIQGNHGDIVIKRIMGNNAVSIQANILMPIKTFSDREKVSTFFKGVSFPFETVFDKLSSATISNSINNDTVKGAVFLAAYFCFIYSNAGRKFDQSVEKQVFPILPKIDLLVFLREIKRRLDSSEPNPLITHLQSLKKLKDLLSSRTKIFDANVAFLINEMSSPNSTVRIAPHIGSVLPIYNSGIGLCIVMEVRKGTVQILRDISEGRVPNGIW